LFIEGDVLLGWIAAEQRPSRACSSLSLTKWVSITEACGHPYVWYCCMYMAMTIIIIIIIIITWHRVDKPLCCNSTNRKFLACLITTQTISGLSSLSHWALAPPPLLLVSRNQATPGCCSPHSFGIRLLKLGAGSSEGDQSIINRLSIILIWLWGRLAGPPVQGSNTHNQSPA
jgi:hypothetical protein